MLERLVKYNGRRQIPLKEEQAYARGLLETTLEPSKRAHRGALLKPLRQLKDTFERFTTRSIKSQEPFLHFEPKFRQVVLGHVGELPLKEIAHVPVVRASVLQMEGLKLSPGDAPPTTVDLQFGRITKKQFQTLQREFGSMSKVSYHENKSYSALDFLPPLLQHLVHLDIDFPEAVELPGSVGWAHRFRDRPMEIGITMNCHATTYETVRAFQQDIKSARIFLGEMIVMDDLAHAKKKFQELHVLQPDKVLQLSTLNLRPGDMIHYYEENPDAGARYTNLIHSATYVGGGLFFEKLNTETPWTDCPFRLVTADMLTSSATKLVGCPISIQVFRPIEDLVAPEKCFVNGFEKELKRLEKKTGRPIGMHLVTEIEQSTGGGILDVHLSAMAMVTFDELRKARFGLRKLFSIL